MVYRKSHAAFLAGCWQRAFPPRCLICRGPGAGAIALCEPCLEDLPWQRPGCVRCADPWVQHVPGVPCGRCQQRPPAFCRVRAPLAYEAPVDRWIRDWKFGGKLSLGPTLAALWQTGVAKKAGPGARVSREVDLLVPVPLHVDRLLERGFNQTLELARFLSHRLALPVRHRCLIKARSGVPQSLLNVSDRRRSLRGVYRVASAGARRELAGRRVALVDDVVTSGSTAHACAERLRAAGASSVEVWAISRA